VENIVKHVEQMVSENEQRFDLINSSISLEIANAVKKAFKQHNSQKPSLKPKEDSNHS
jgi:ubiquinone/menaquinone biosynthesis C-methylase UbiE